jgi:hypothetical protein
MKTWHFKTLILTAGVSFVISVAGCEEHSLSDIKKCRLIAYENKQLKEQLEKQEHLYNKEVKEQKKLNEEQIEKQKELYEKEIAKQKKLFDEELKQQKKLLADCLQRKPPDESLREEIENLMDSARRDLELFGELQGENERLKVQISKLEAQVSQLEKQLEQSED